MEKQIAKQSFSLEEKSGVLNFKSTKFFSDGSKREDKSIEKVATLKPIAMSGKLDRHDAMKKHCKELGLVAALKLDSQAKKTGQCRNTGYCTLADAIFRHFNSPKVYIAPKAKKAPKSKSSKSSKKTMKKTTAVPAVKKQAKKTEAKKQAAELVPAIA